MLPILSKIFEKHVCDHLHSFLKVNFILHQLQAGFQKFHSTQTALVHLVDQLLMDLDNNRVSGLVFVQYKKAFDLIDHQLLLQKLEIYGIQRNELKLFCNYLSDRFQYVDINGNPSSSRRVTSRCPTGKHAQTYFISPIH